MRPKRAQINLNRRNFLKVAMFGLGSLFLGGIISSIFRIGEDDSRYALPIRSYKVLEKDNALIFFNSKGQKLFTVDDNGDFIVEG